MIKYRIIAKAKKYKLIDGYSANASSSTAFLTHVTKKFQKQETDFLGNKYYIQRFTTLDLLKASSKGHIVIEFVGVVKPERR
jgi:hypothetical protein